MFCGVLIRFLKVTKLESFEFSVNDIIPANVKNILPLVSFAFFVRFMEKKPPIKFYGVLYILYKLMKL